MGCMAGFIGCFGVLELYSELVEDHFGVLELVLGLVPVGLGGL